MLYTTNKRITPFFITSMKFLKCLKTACDDLKIKYSYIGDNPRAIIVKSNSRELFFINSTTSLNSHAHAYTADDKFFTYKLLENVIRMPKTVSYLDPYCRPEYQKLAKFSSFDSIAENIIQRIGLPCIVKRNRGFHGINVFRCISTYEIENSIKTIFNHDSKDYDYVALAQEEIVSKHEYRVVVFDNKIQFMYEKDTTEAKIIDNISPFHQENAKAVLVKDSKLIQDMQQFIDPIFDRFPIRFAGLDVIRDNRGDLYLIEINSSPGFDYFIRDCGEGEVVELYKTMLQSCA